MRGNAPINLPKTQILSRTNVNSRCEGVVLLITANACAILVVCFVIKVELVEPVGKSKQHQTVDEEELQYVQEHSAQGDLQGAQVGVGSEEADEAQ